MVFKRVTKPFINYKQNYKHTAAFIQYVTDWISAYINSYFLPFSPLGEGY